MPGIDILVIQDSEGDFDIQVEDGDLVGVDGLDTAIYLSLCTDARADESQVRLPEKRRGWVGDTVSPVENRPLGGLGWLVEQRRLTQSTVNTAVDLYQKSLQWMIEDGLAKDITVTGEIVPIYGIALSIIIITLDGRTSTHYVPLWEVTGV